MAFNHVAVVVFVCFAASTMSLSNAQIFQEWGEYSPHNVKVFDDIEWFLPKQGYREGKFNFPAFVSSDKYRKLNNICAISKNDFSSGIFTGRRRD